MNTSKKSLSYGVAFGLMALSVQATAGIVFQDNFDSQPDFVGDDHLSGTKNTLWAVDGDTVPQGWSAVSLWSYFNPPSFMQITAANADKAYGGKGKSLVIRRGSGSVAWSGDAQLAKNFDPGYDSLYVSFYIKFQPGWTPEGMSKIFRIGHYAPGARGSAYWSALNMGVLWEWTHFSATASGLRNFIHLNSDGAENFTNPPIKTHYTSLINNKEISANYTSDPYDISGSGVKDNYPNLIDHTTGKVIPDGGVVGTQAMVFGDGWNKIAFYVKVNSSPGVQDGVLMEWFNDHLILSNDTIPWIQADGDATAKFNAVKFGGNDFWQTYPTSDKVTQWYSIDNVIMRTDIPPGVQLKPGIPPQSPGGITIK